MKATDRQLLDICTELTAHIITPTDNLNLSRDECIILNGLISEEFERREEQDVMDVVYRQDPSLGQTGDNHNDDALNASERWDSEVSGVEVRKKKPQITKVSKKEYWDNRDKHGTYLPTCDMTNQPEVPYLGFMPYPDEHIPVAWMHEKVQQNFMLKSLFYGILSDWDFEADKYEAKGMNLVLYPKWLYIPLPYIVEKAKDPISNSRYRAIIQFWKQDRYMWTEYRPEPKPYTTKAFNTDKVNRNGTLYDFDTNDFLEQSKKIAEKASEVTEAVDKLITGTRGDELAKKGKADDNDSIPIAWLKSEIEETRKFLKTETDEKVMHDEIAYIVNINSIINCWGRYGKDDWKEKEKNTNETSDYPVGSFGYERERLANEVEDILEKNGINPNETTDEITQLDDLKDTEKINSEIKVSKGAMSIDAYKLFGQSFDEKCFRFNGVPLLDKYIPVAWMRERIEFNSPYADSYRKVIDSWNSFGKDLWYRDIHN